MPTYDNNNNLQHQQSNNQQSAARVQHSLHNSRFNHNNNNNNNNNNENLNLNLNDNSNFIEVNQDNLHQSFLNNMDTSNRRRPNFQ